MANNKCIKNNGGSCRDCSNYRYDSDAKKFECFANRSEASKFKSFTVVAPEVKDWVITVAQKKYNEHVSSYMFRAQATVRDIHEIMGRIANDFVDESSLQVEYLYGDPYFYTEGEKERDVYSSHIQLTDENKVADEFIDVTAQLFSSLPVKTIKDFEKEGC